MTHEEKSRSVPSYRPWSTFFRLVLSGVLGATVSTVAGVVLATTVAVMTFRISSEISAPVASGEQSLVPDFAVYGLIMPGLLILATAPIPGAIAATVVQRYRHQMRVALAATVVVCVSQAVIIDLLGGNLANLNMDVLVAILLVIILPVFVGMYLSTWLVPKCVQPISWR